MNAIIAKSIVAISLAAALTGFSVSARAVTSAVKVRSVTVRYAELDLAKPQGVEALYMSPTNVYLASSRTDLHRATVKATVG